MYVQYGMYMYVHICISWQMCIPGSESEAEIYSTNKNKIKDSIFSVFWDKIEVVDLYLLAFNDIS
jgi:hypothetical protein